MAYPAKILSFYKFVKTNEFGLPVSLKARVIRGGRSTSKFVNVYSIIVEECGVSTDISNQ